MHSRPSSRTSLAPSAAYNSWVRNSSWRSAFHSAPAWSYSRWCRPRLLRTMPRISATTRCSYSAASISTTAARSWHSRPNISAKPSGARRATARPRGRICMWKPSMPSSAVAIACAALSLVGCHDQRPDVVFGLDGFLSSALPRVLAAGSLSESVEPFAARRRPRGLPFAARRGAASSPVPDAAAPSAEAVGPASPSSTGCSLSCETAGWASSCRSLAAGFGALEMIEPGDPYIVRRKVDMTDLPADLAALEKNGVTLFSASGESCQAKLGQIYLIAGVFPHFGTVQPLGGYLRRSRRKVVPRGDCSRGMGHDQQQIPGCRMAGRLRWRLGCGRRCQQGSGARADRG